MSAHEHAERGMQGDIGHIGPKGEKGEKGLDAVAPFVLRHLTVLFLIVCLGTAFAIYQTIETAQKADRQFCLVAQENRTLLKDLVNRTGNTTNIPPNASPELRQVLEQSRKSGQEFRDYANSRLTDVECPK